MPYRSMSEFIDALDRAGELIRIPLECDPVLEIPCIADRISRLDQAGNKALLFEKVTGSSMPILMNAFGSEKRLSMMAGVEDYAGMTAKLSGFLEVLQTPRKNLVEKIKALPVLRDVARCFPKYVKRAPCQEIVLTGDQIDLEAIPILKTWPEDGGHFVTMPLVFTKDPIDGKRNCGMYRIQRYDKTTTGFHCHTHHTGADHIRKAKKLGRDKLEIAICIGAAPSVAFSAVVPLPPGLDEMIFAGFLNDSPVPMVKCKTIDQEVPASAEIVLEGYVNVDERRLEGPFGDHTGFYSLADNYWVFNCTAVTMRKNPVYHATVVGPPPQEDSHMAAAIERLFLPLMQQPLPEVEDYHLAFEGVAHNLMQARIKKSYPGQGRKVAHSVWGLGQAMFTKAICVGDHTTPAFTDYNDYAKYMAKHVDVANDIQTVVGPTETLDHATPAIYLGSKVSVDLTEKYPSEAARAKIPQASDTPDDATILAALRERVQGVTNVRSPWSGADRHLLLVALDKRAERNATSERYPNTAKRAPEPGVVDTRHLTGSNARQVVSALWELFPELAAAQRVIVFDAGEDLADGSRLVWKLLANIDPDRDISFDWSFEERDGVKTPVKHPRRIGIDATSKGPADGFFRKWPAEQAWPEELLERVGKRWEDMGLPKLDPALREKLGL